MVPIVTKLASMATTSLITACMAYQAYEMNKLKDEERIIKISSLLINVSVYNRIAKKEQLWEH